MKLLLKDAYHSDHALEVIFSSLRWFFLILSIVVFFVQYDQNPSQIKLIVFISLVIFGFMYMGISDYYLYKSSKGSKMYTLMTKGGPAFDFIAYSALTPLTGGINSPLIPIAYLIILHIAVYWRFIGGVIAASVFILMYSIFFFIQISDVASINSLISYFSHVIFLLLIGFLGGVVVSRERKHHSEKNLLVEAANRDYLTNLLNHRSFQESLRKDLESGLDFYLVLTDIDKFKLINDKYGHVTGDKVLSQIGEIITSIIPAKKGKVFRYGGEEFAIILYCQEHHEVNKFLVEIKQSVSNHSFYFEGEAFSITMSFGTCKKRKESPGQLVEKVDKLLYEAKDRGRIQIVYSDVG